MTQPAVNITVLDGALGVQPSSPDGVLAVLGVSSSGPLNTPAAYRNLKAFINDFGAGPMVEAAARHIDVKGKTIIAVRTGSTVAGSVGTPALAGSGTSVPTIAASPTPNDDYDIAIKVVAGGTRGTAGITYQYSLDDGANYSPIQSLGTATAIAVPGAGGVTVSLGVGTLVAGDLITVRTVAPNWNSTEIGTALDALRNYAGAWDEAHIVGPIDATAFDAIDTKFSGMRAAGKYHGWIGNTRVPNAGESEATYLAAMVTIFGSKSTVYGALCSGAAKVISSVSSRKYRRPVAFIAASEEAAASEEVDTADVNRGSLTGVSIRDVNGNPEQHDESVNPGLDDARFYSLRTWDDFQGVYVNRPRLFSADGSDFQLVPHLRVMNLALRVLRPYMARRLNKPIRVNKTTGHILEEEAAEIESGARQVLAAALLAKPKASDVQFALSRTDNLLSTKTLTGDARVVPLAYPETINLTVGFLNPALQIQAVA